MEDKKKLIKLEDKNKEEENISIQNENVNVDEKEDRPGIDYEIFGTPKP